MMREVQFDEKSMVGHVGLEAGGECLGESTGIISDGHDPVNETAGEG